MLRTFRQGGIHPKENKLTAGESIKYIEPVKQVVIPICQHIGSPSIPVVAKGDNVKVGTLIAKSSGFISANIHSSVSGKVFKIDDVYDFGGYKKPAIIINVEGDEWEDSIDRSKDIVRDFELLPLEIVKKIMDMGIVGLGGATFPTNIKLSPPPSEKVDILIINAVECEPYLTSDHILMMTYSEEILVGITILMKAIGVDRCIIGIENNKKDAIELFTQKVKYYSGIKVQPLKVKYPQGGEKQLIEATIGKQVKSGKLPVSTGVVVHNVGTVFAVYQAIQKNKPLIERVVTVTGKKVSIPSNFMARIGTPISALIEKAGGLPEDTGKIIGGGPMMGKSLLSLDIPVTKGCSGIVILCKEESFRNPMSNCIRCAKCVNVCPMGLNPAFLMRDVIYNRLDKCEDGYIIDCIECGSCNYICPSNRPILDYIRIGKQNVVSLMRNRKS